jgi:hypothetical protein
MHAIVNIAEGLPPLRKSFSAIANIGSSGTWAVVLTVLRVWLEMFC